MNVQVRILRWYFFSVLSFLQVYGAIKSQLLRAAKDIKLEATIIDIQKGHAEEIANLIVRLITCDHVGKLIQTILMKIFLGNADENNTV